MEFQVKVNGFLMVFKWVNGFCKWKTNDFKWSDNKWNNNGFSMDFILVRMKKGDGVHPSLEETVSWQWQ